MSARRIGAAIAAVTLVSSGSYVFAYLYRWEWNRALICGVIFLAAEIALATLFLSGRLRRLGEDTASLRAERTARQLRATAPAGRDHFAWISRPQDMHVFVPVLMGAGIVLSALAWGVERIARLTARPILERGLARRLATMAPPVGGFVTADDDARQRLRRPSRHAAA